jgi:cell division protein FtsQ
MPRRLLRRALLAAAATLLVLAGAFVFLRDSPMFEIREVTVVGVSGPDAPKVEAELRQAARTMTTLNVSADELRKAAHRYPTVEDVEIDRDLPHGVTLTVREKRAVAIVERGGRRVPVAADGRLLEGATPPDDLPTLAQGKVGEDRVTGDRGRQLVAVVSAAPAALRRRTQRAEIDGELGLVLKLDRGPDLYFGTATDLQAKWRAAARVLADPTAEGATYIDVRVPERAAAGGLAPLSDPGTDQEVPANGQPSTSTGA